ncbi:hypothetical protein PT974_02004 [Cladobotryum mycophilum]|uniref:MARVEL domain-containing protein n=1 Tax=Cladobotryum mycophilum TaxID=491253 RepID=A0ABR0SXZ7_9HYPO
MAPLDVVVQRILLGLEFCISAAAAGHFGYAHFTSLASNVWDAEECTLDSQGGQCSSDAPPETEHMLAERVLDSGLAIAVLSLVVVVARVAMMRMKYSPRYTNMFYDMLLCFLWIVTTTKQAMAVAATSNSGRIGILLWPLYNKKCDAVTGGSRDFCQTAQAALVISILASLLYCGKLLVAMFELAALAFGLRPKTDNMTVTGVGRYRDTEEPRGMEAVDTADKVYAEAMSPVLAFFPEDI